MKKTVCLLLATLVLSVFSCAAGAYEASADLKTAYFAEGCFWKTQHVFSEVPGVVKTEVGYTGGHVKNPTYEKVCSHATNHAEACKVIFDPRKVSYDDLLSKFFSSHDPTTLDRQGPDVGDQYRSAICYVDDEQKRLAESAKAKLDASHKYKDPVVTVIAPETQFWKAEDYHQNYYAKHGQVCF